MKKSDIKIDSIVGAKSDEEISKPFEGKVEKYTKTQYYYLLHPMNQKMKQMLVILMEKL